MIEQAFRFYHGLGDISNFARMIPIYDKYGIDLSVQTSDNKTFTLTVGGAHVIEAGSKQVEKIHGWWIPTNTPNLECGAPTGWIGNKSGENLIHFGLQDACPDTNQLWKEYKAVDLQSREHISLDIWKKVESVIQDWPRPIVLWHSMGNTNQVVKSFNEENQKKFLHSLIDHTDGTILLLDWDNRISWTNNHRIKHLLKVFGNLDLKELAALMYQSQLMIGVDSGPYYFSALTDIPSVGVYMDNLHPCEYAVPNDRTLTFATGNKGRNFTSSKRFEFQVMNFDSMEYLASWSSRMLDKNRYFKDSVPIATDVHLQQIIQEKCRGSNPNGISTIYDRNRSFDILLIECKKRFAKPVFVETGCIRADEDWGGAGSSTCIFGQYVSKSGGSLTSFDLSKQNVDYATRWCRQFGPSVNIIKSVGEEGLRQYPGMVDVLYLDSLDTEDAGHQACNLAEFKAAEDKLHDKSIVVIDDSPNNSVGKGGLTTKYMVDKGWKFLYRGYQVVLTRVL